MNENVFLSLFCSFSRTQVREIRLRGSPRFRNKVEGEKRSPPLCPRPMEITFRLCDKFAADYSRIVMIPSMRVVPSFIASQKFCKKKKKLLYYYGYPRRSLRKRKREKKNREREKREQSGWKDDGEAREIIISGNRSTIDTIGGYIYSDEAKKDWRKREKDDRSFLE